VGRPAEVDQLVVALEQLFDQMIDQQRRKVLKLAREAVPHLSSEDVLNPHDYPELKAHPTFEFEDGLLSGLIAAQIAFTSSARSAIAFPSPHRRATSNNTSPPGA